MAKKRWVFIHPFQLRLQRGIEVYLWNLATALAQQGILVDILTWEGSLEIPDFARIPGVRLNKVPYVRYFQSQFAVLFYIFWLLKGKYEHIFVNFAGYGEGLTLNLLGLLRPVPFSVVFHFPPSLVPHRYQEFRKWNLERNAKNLIGVSLSTAEEIQNWAGRPCNMIGHGVNSKRFSPNAKLRIKIREEFGFGIDTPILISVSALEERKGIQFGLQAMANLISEIKDIHYLILGTGEYLENLNNLVQQLKIGSHIHFLGAKLNVQPYLCAADIILALSRGEASSISVIEALACQLPAITSKQPPYNELISEKWGIMVDENNTTQLANSIKYLINDPERRYSMGKAGRESVIKAHSWDKIANQYVRLIN